MMGNDYLDLVYLNGIQVPNSSLPNARNLQLDDTVTMPTPIRVIAVQVTNIATKAGLLVSSFVSKYPTILTNSSWKCTDQTPQNNWYTVNYNDSSWPPAVQDYQNGFKGSSNISSSAYWIWTKNLQYNVTIYCRLNLIN